MAAASIPEEYKRRAAIIEGLRAGRSPTKINRRNNCWFVYDPEDVPIIARTKCPTNVHVLGVVSSKDDVMPPHFFAKIRKRSLKKCT